MKCTKIIPLLLLIRCLHAVQIEVEYKGNVYQVELQKQYINPIIYPTLAEYMQFIGEGYYTKGKKGDWQWTPSGHNSLKKKYEISPSSYEAQRLQEIANKAKKEHELSCRTF